MFQYGLTSGALINATLIISISQAKIEFARLAINACHDVLFCLDAITLVCLNQVMVTNYIYIFFFSGNQIFSERIVAGAYEAVIIIYSKQQTTNLQTDRLTYRFFYYAARGMVFLQTIGNINAFKTCESNDKPDGPMHSSLLKPSFPLQVSDVLCPFKKEPKQLGCVSSTYG